MWDDNSSSSSESEVDKAHVCFMAHTDSDVSSSSNSSQNEISYDDLVEGFRDLMLSFRSLKSKFSNLKKEHNCSISKLSEVSKERDLALHELKKAKNNFILFKDTHKCDSSFNEEMKLMQNRIDCLSTTLSECASHTLKLESLHCKKVGFQNNVFRKSQPQPIRKQHKRVFHCKVCGRDGHLAMFCYDNIANTRVRGQHPNVFGHKSQWAPKDRRFPPHVWEAMY